MASNSLVQEIFQHLLLTSRCLCLCRWRMGLMQLLGLGLGLGLPLPLPLPLPLLRRSPPIWACTLPACSCS